ncbi:hypothetical protein [Lentzea aerocolonigenes]|uniref:hypothetical protein n=1 Tax=Lentzea aerocolonigenes TaxID=68170 RepID=UPI0006961C44|nr:hypothetical protein [Lentzea aerocolonigenes]
MSESNESLSALRMMPWARESVDQAERVLIEAVLDGGWTWEQLGAEYGGRSKQAMQQHYKRRGGQRTWSRRTGSADVEAVRDAITRLLLNFRATDEALTRTMRDASWNEKDPDTEARRRRSWVERLNDSMDSLHDFINNRMGKVPRWEGHEVPADLVDEVEAGTAKALERLRQHRDEVDATIAELLRRQAGLSR